jgi:hypothetical protein
MSGIERSPSPSSVRLALCAVVLAAVMGASLVAVGGSVSATPAATATGDVDTSTGPVERGAADATRAVNASASAAADADQGDAVESLGEQTVAPSFHEDAAAAGIRQGVALARERGARISDAQVEAATESAVAAAAQWQEASAAQIQQAAAGAAHGAFIQEQVTNVSQLQAVVQGSVDGALSQYQRANATQVQSAAYGSAHGSLAQRQSVTVSQLQVTASGAAAGAADGAAAMNVAAIGKIQEAAQGAAYGSLQRKDTSDRKCGAAARGAAYGALINYQEANVKQIQVAAIGGAKGALVQSQRVTVEQIQFAARGGAAGSLRQVQRVTVEQIQAAAQGGSAGTIESVVQRQTISVEQIQAAAQGGAAGGISQGQSVTAEQVQAAARGAGSGAVLQFQSATVEQIQSAAFGASHGALVQGQRVTIEQIQFAARGASSGALVQVQNVTIEQIQFAARGAASGVVTQRQSVSVRQAQAAARGAAHGAIEESIQVQEVTVEQIQAAARGAAKGGLSQRQSISVSQVQAAAHGAAGGALRQRQTVTVEQIQRAAQGAAEGSTAAVVQRQTITIEQIQAAAGGAAEGALTQIQRISVTQVQYAARGAAKGSLTQVQQVTIEQIQAAAQGAASGGVQSQQVTVIQVQIATQNAASGALSQSQRVTVEQIQGAARGTCQGVLTQVQRISITQLQYITWDSAAQSAFSASQAGLSDVEEIADTAANESGERVTDPSPAPTAELSVGDQVVENRTVTVESVTLSEGGFVVLRNESYEAGDVLGSIVGVSDYLEPGESEDVTVTLDEPLGTNQTLTAVAHLDTNDNQTFDFRETYAIEDGVYARENAPVIDRASVSVPPEPTTANVTVQDQSSDGSTVTVSAANLSNGGFLAVHSDGFSPDDLAGSIVGTSDYLEPGETGSVTVELDEPLTERGPVFVVAYRDTDEDRRFDFVNSAGETDVPYRSDGVPTFGTASVTVIDASLDVGDQTGDGGNLSVDSASATVDYALRVQSDDATLNETAEFDANETFTGNLTLDPPLEANATLDVAVVEAETGDALTVQSVNYTVPGAALPPENVTNATLDVADQSGDGTTLTVANASAPVDYVLTAVVDGDVLNETAVVNASEPFAGTLTLDPPLGENATVTVTVRNATSDEALVNETVNYTVAAGEPEPPAENTTLDVTDQTGDGATLAITNASATVGYVLTASVDSEVRNRTAVFEAGESFSGNLSLDPPIEENATVTVAVVANETGGELTNQTVEYTVETEPPEPPAENATLDVSNQTGDGVNLSVTNASATVDYYLTATAEGETLNQTEAFAAGTTFDGVLTLDPPLTENATVTVAVVANETDEELANRTAEYTVEAEPPEPPAPTPPNASLDVADQTGDGGNLSVANASATVEYYLSAAVDGDVLNETEPIDANRTFAGNLTLDPALEANATVAVTVRNATSDEALVNETVNYTVADVTPPGENATLDVADQTGDGSSLAVANASAPVDYVITASVDEEVRNRTAARDADESFSGNLTLDPALEENTTVTVAVLDNATDEELTNQTVEYTVEPEPPEPPAPTPPNASLDVADQTGDGGNLSVANASATVEYLLTASADGDVLNETASVDANETFAGNLTLDPPLEANATVDVSVRDAETGAVLANASVNYTVAAAPNVTGPDATVAFANQSSNGTVVTVDTATLPDGGFVAVHDQSLLEGDAVGSVVGSSAYLEPGTAENVTVELDEPLDANGTLIAMPHRDTNENEVYDFVTSNGTEDGPYTVDGDPVTDAAAVTVAPDDGAAPPVNATLDVVDQSGDGTTLAVTNASADTNYSLTASVDGEVRNQTAVIAAGESFSGNLTLEPALEENATVAVAVIANETGEELINQPVNYTVEIEPPAPPAPNATLDVSEQTGNGSTLIGVNASATVDYSLTASVDGEVRTQTSVFAANEVFSGNLTLEPALEENATVTVAVVANETGEELANASVEYTVVTEPPAPPAPNATLSVTDQTGDGTNLTVTDASATVNYTVTASVDGEVRNQTAVFEAGESFSGNLTLSPALDENATVTVAVVADETGEELTNRTVNYTVAAEEPEPTPPSATLDVADQAGNGTTFVVANASATVDYSLTASVDSEVRNRTAARDADESFSGNLTLDPPIEENATVTVAVVANETGEELTNQTVGYTVETEPPEPPAPPVLDATLSVMDQTGDGTNLTVTDASATVNYTVTASVDGEVRNRTGVFAADELFSGSLTLDPPLEENATVTVTVRNATSDEALVSETLNYAVTPEEPEPTPASASLDVADQTGDGGNLSVANASATVDYSLAVSAAGETRNETAAFAAGRSFAGNLTLDPPLEDNATVTVSVLDDATGEELTNRTVEYTVAAEPPAPAPNGTLSVADQTGDGANFTIASASATVDYYLVASVDGEVLNRTENRSAGESFAGNLTLDPALEDNATVTVAVRSAETDADLATRPVEYAVVAPESAPALNLTLADQTGDGTNLTVANATADRPFTLTVESNETALNRTSVAAGEAFSGNLTLDPVVGENSTLTVSLADAETGEVLNQTNVAYTAALTDATVAALSRYADVDAAVRDGYVDTHRFAANETGATGIRFVNTALLDGEREPRRPEMLLYTINATGQYELVGVEWAVTEAAADEAPALFDRSFAGPVPGHTTEMASHYELIGWPYLENPDGLFAPTNPDLAVPELIEASDQTGNGSTVQVDRTSFNATAFETIPDEYYVEVRDADGTVLGQSATLRGPATDLSITLDEALTETATVTLALHHADSGAEIADPVARENVTVAVTAPTATPTDTPTATEEPTEGETPGETTTPTATASVPADNESTNATSA